MKSIAMNTMTFCNIKKLQFCKRKRDDYYRVY